MRVTLHPQTRRLRWMDYSLFIVILLSSMSTGQTQSTSRSLSLDRMNSAGGFIDTGGAGLIKPSERFDTSANLMVTGNVGGGKHFRATVPYTSASDFQQTLQSAYLDSFRRYTQDINLNTQTPLAYTPFYSPTATVTHTRPGQSSVVTSTGLTSTSFGTTVSSAENRSTTSMISVDQIQSEDPTLQELERIIVREAATSPTAAHLQPWQTALQDSEALLRQATWLDTYSNQDQEITTDAPEPTARPDQGTVILSEEMQHLVVDTEASYDSKEVDNDPTQTSLITPDIQQDIEQAQALLDSLDSLNKIKSDVPTMPDESVILSTPIEPSPIVISDALPKDMTLHAFHEAKYDTFIKAGEAYLKQGQYQQAENAYTMAGVHRSNDAEAWAGRSVTLLAQEEYAGSALFLKRALFVVPDYAKVKIDLPALVGGMDAVVKHVKALKPFQDNPHTPDLHLLLAYIYLQMNDLGLAQKILDNAILSRPDDLAIKALQAALTKAMEPQP